MHRILSARIDDSIYRKIKDLSLKMHASPKAVIEKAIDLLGKNYQEASKSDIFDETCGVWNRKETPAETVSNIRAMFNAGMKRYER